jgi:hypothetical protein
MPERLPVFDLHKLLPSVSTIALLGNPGNPSSILTCLNIQTTADALIIKQRLQVSTANAEGDLEAALRPWFDIELARSHHSARPTFDLPTRTAR